MNIGSVRFLITQAGLELLFNIENIPMAGMLTIQKTIPSEELANMNGYQFTGQSIKPFDDGVKKGMELIIAESQQVRAALTEILWNKRGTVLKIKLENVPVIGELMHEEVIEYDKLRKRDGITVTFTSMNPIIEGDVLRGISLEIAETAPEPEEIIPAKPKNKSRRKKLESQGYRLLGKVMSLKLGVETEIWHHKERGSMYLWGENAKSDRMTMGISEKLFQKITDEIKDKPMLPASGQELYEKLKPTLGIGKATIYIWEIVALFKKMIEIKRDGKKIIIEKLI